MLAVLLVVVGCGGVRTGGTVGVVRSASYLKALFRVSGMKLVSEEAQEGFPDELFPVVMFAFAPQH